MQKIFSITLILFTGTAYANHGELPSLGSGKPGLMFAEYKNHFVVFNDIEDCAGLGFRSGGWRDRHIEAIYDSATQTIGGATFDPGEHFPAGWNGNPLFPFDQNSAFLVKEVPVWVDGRLVGNRRSTQLLRWKSSCIEVQDIDVYAEARRLYALTNDEDFLGVLDSNVFFTEKGVMNRVFWKKNGSVGELHSVLVQRQILAYYGVTRGMRKGFCLVAIAKSEGAFPYSPNEGVVLNLNL